MTNWLMVLPRQHLPPGIGTISADTRGVYIERLAEDFDGQSFTWQQVVDRLLTEPEPALPAPGWPVRDTGIPAFYPAEEPVPVGIPVFGTDQTLDYTPEQVAHIRRLHAELGSLKAVQREIYGQEGGYWFYQIRDAVRG